MRRLLRGRRGHRPPRCPGPCDSGVDSAHFTPYSPGLSTLHRTVTGDAQMQAIVQDTLRLGRGPRAQRHRQARDRRRRGPGPRPRGRRQPRRLGGHERPAVHRAPGIRAAQAEEQRPGHGRGRDRRGGRRGRDAASGRATRSSAGARARSPSTRPRPRTHLALKPANLTFEQAAAVADGRPRRAPGACAITARSSPARRS